MRFALVFLFAAACGGTPSHESPDLSAAPDFSSMDAASELDATLLADLEPGTVGCSTPGLLFCEDFEASAAGTATSTKWTSQTGSGSLTIDGTHAYGTQALHVHTDDNGHAYILPSSFSPPGNSFYGRMRAWMTAFPSGSTYAHFTMVEAAGKDVGTLVRPVGGQVVSGASQWGVGTDGGPTGDWLNSSPPTTDGAWVCVEWQLTSANDEVDVWLDGVPQPSLTVTETKHGGTAGNFVFPTFSSIWFGYFRYQAGATPTSTDLWLDDIVLSTTRIGC